MMHTPVLLVVDEVDSPRMWIVQSCKECGREVSRHAIDVSISIPDGAQLGSADGDSWLKHIAEGNA